MIRLVYSLADQDFERTKSVGILNVSVHLARALSMQDGVGGMTVLANSSLRPRLSLGGRAIVRWHEGASRGRFSRIWWDQVAVYRAARQAGGDWLLLPKGFASSICAPPMRLAAYVHDTIQWHYRERYPGVVPRLEAAYFERSLRATLRHATVILTNSEFTASEVRRVAGQHGWPLPRVVPVGIGFQRISHSDPGSEDRVVVLASSWPHKRTALAVQYLRRWQETTPYGGRICLVGALPGSVAVAGWGGWEHRPRLAEDEYRRVVGSARALVYFSDYEGFGMPPVEATLDGVPAVYSRIPAALEAMGEAGWSFENESFESFCFAMDSALESGRERIQAWGEILLARHRWDEVARRSLAALAAEG